MHIGFITQWYDPEPGPAALPGGLARALVARGHKVTVVTGFPNYPTGDIAEGYRLRPFQHEVLDGVVVIRTWLYPSHDGSALKRITNYASFAVSSSPAAAWFLRDVDALYVNYSPITTALPMWAAQLTSRARTVLEVADLWPDTILAAGLGGGQRIHQVAGNFLHLWCRAMYRSADVITYLSPGVGEVLAARGVPRHKLVHAPKWANQEMHRSTGRSMREELGIGDETVVLVYAGTLGEAQGLDGLVDAMHTVSDLPVMCLIAGSGTAEESLREAAAGLPNVRFLGRLSPDRMPDLMATADLSYVSLNDDGLAPITMPSKTQASLAAGVPLLVSAPGDLARMVEDLAVGFAAPPRDPLAIGEALRGAVDLGRRGLSELSRHATAVYQERFSLARAAAHHESLLSESHPEPSAQEVTPLHRSDARRLAEMHQRAFPTFFLSSLGQPFLRQFYAGYAEDQSAVCFVARDENGDPVGAVTGTIEPAGFYRRLLQRRLVGFGLASAQAAVRNPRAIPRLLKAVRYRGDAPDITGPHALLSSICVDPDAQGTGAGKRLLRAWVDAVRERGIEHAFLTTDAADNDAVNRFYQRLGWRLHDTYTTPQGRVMNRYAAPLPSGSVAAPSAT